MKHEKSTAVSKRALFCRRAEYRLYIVFFPCPGTRNVLALGLTKFSSDVETRGIMGCIMWAEDMSNGQTVPSGFYFYHDRILKQSNTTAYIDRIHR